MGNEFPGNAVISSSKLKNAFIANSLEAIASCGVGGVKRVSLLDELPGAGAVGMAVSPLVFSKNMWKRLSQTSLETLLLLLSTTGDIAGVTFRSTAISLGGDWSSAAVLVPEISKTPGISVPWRRA